MEKRLRLRQAKDFARLRQEGRVYRHPFLILSLSPNMLMHNRYGFITARNLGKAIVRNRVRRLLREAVRQLHPDLVSGFDVVIVARTQAVEQTFASLQRAVKETFHRAEMIVDEE